MKYRVDFYGLKISFTSFGTTVQCNDNLLAISRIYTCIYILTLWISNACNNSIISLRFR